MECSSKVSSELRMHQSTAAVAFLPSLLERGVPIMMFVGAEDLICNYAGIERMMAGMEWSGAKGLGVSAVSHPVISTADSRDVIKNATVNEWYLNNTQVGEWTESRNLTYAKVGMPSPQLLRILTLPLGVWLLAYGRFRRASRCKRHDDAVHGRRVCPAAWFAGE